MQELEEEQRSDAVSSMVYEANARIRDPVYGCVGTISCLQRQVDALQQQLAMTQAELLRLKIMGQFSSATSESESQSKSSSTGNNINMGASPLSSLWSCQTFPLLYNLFLLAQFFIICLLLFILFYFIVVFLDLTIDKLYM